MSGEGERKREVIEIGGCVHQGRGNNEVMSKRARLREEMDWVGAAQLGFF